MNRRILALDTSGATGSLALAEDGRLIEETALFSADGFAHTLFQHLESLLRRHGWRARDVGCIAVGAGPGSFTGIRVALSAAKGLAEATGAKVVGVSNLKAVAWYGNGPLRAAFADARRGQVYGGVFDHRLRKLREEVAAPFPEWLASLPAGELELISPDAATFQPFLDAALRQSAKILPCPRAIAGAIAMIAWADWEAGAALPPEQIDANYVRRSDAELFWKDAR